MTKVFSVILAVALTVAIVIGGLFVHMTNVAKSTAERVAYAFIIK